MSCAITMEIPIELATLRIRVSIAVPSVRKWLGSVKNATVESGTKTRPNPKPWMMLQVTISRTPVWSVHPSHDEQRDCRQQKPADDQRARLDITHQTPDQHHGDECAAAAACEQHAGGDDRIADRRFADRARASAMVEYNTRPMTAMKMQPVMKFLSLNSAN